MAWVTLLLAFAVTGCGSDSGTTTITGGTWDATVAESSPQHATGPAEDADTVRTSLAVSSDISLDVDPCELLTETEIGEVLGATVGAPESWTEPPFHGCNYATEGGDLSVTVVVYSDADFALEFFRDTVELNEYPEVPGLGDAAYISQPIGDLTVVKGRMELAVDIFSPTQLDETGIAIGLAQKALPRLPP